MLMGWEEKLRWIAILRQIVDRETLSGEHHHGEEGAWDFAGAAA